MKNNANSVNGTILLMLLVLVAFSATAAFADTTATILKGVELVSGSYEKTIDESGGYIDWGGGIRYLPMPQCQDAEYLLEKSRSSNISDSSITQIGPQFLVNETTSSKQVNRSYDALIYDGTGSSVCNNTVACSGVRDDISGAASTGYYSGSINYTTGKMQESSTCNLGDGYLDYRNKTYKSSLTFKLLCNGSATVKNIHVVAQKVDYNGTQLFINGVNSTAGAYDWLIAWDIPVNISCSETFTLTPSIVPSR